MKLVFCKYNKRTTIIIASKKNKFFTISKSNFE